MVKFFVYTHLFQITILWKEQYWAHFMTTYMQFTHLHLNHENFICKHMKGERKKKQPVNNSTRNNHIQQHSSY